MAVYAVTGGCGFIGAHLVDRLVAAGHAVRVLDDLSTGKKDQLDPAAQLILGDVADPDAVRDVLTGADGCFHLAAVASVTRSISDWRAASRTNGLGAITVFEACAAAGVPVAYASSAAVYGAPDHAPIGESARLAPLSQYGADKAGNETHARIGAVTRGLRSFGLRFFNVFGPRQDPSSPYSGVISIFMDRALAGRDLIIEGDGLQTRDFVYVDDVVDALIAAAGKADATAPVVNIGAGRATTILALAQNILALTGSSAAIAHAAPRLGDIRASVADASAALRLLDWRARTTLEDGLARLAEFARQESVRA